MAHFDDSVSSIDSDSRFILLGRTDGNCQCFYTKNNFEVFNTPLSRVRSCKGTTIDA